MAKAGATRKPVRMEKQPMAWQEMMRHFVVALAVLVLAVAIYYSQQSDTLPIKHVTVEGEFEHVDKSLLVKAVSPYTRGSFLSVDVAKIREAGEALPWVKTIQVRRVWPDSLHLIVHEQVAIAKWRNDELINPQGEVFSSSSDAIPAGLAQLKGPDDTHLIVTKRYVAMSRALKASQLSIQSLEMDKRRAWRMELSNGLHVVLGRADSEQRFSRFLSVYQNSLVKYQNQIAEIDMRYPNGFSVLWKPEQTPEFNGTV